MGFINKIPDNLSSEHVSLLEIIACCLNSQENAIVKRGETVLIFGAGPAGIIHALFAKLGGASKIIITQRSKQRLDSFAYRFPNVVDLLISSSETNLYKTVMDITSGEGANTIFVCALSKQAQEQALKLVSNRGKINFFGGLPKDDCMVALDANDLHYREFFISVASSYVL